MIFNDCLVWVSDVTVLEEIHGEFMVWNYRFLVLNTGDHYEERVKMSNPYGI